MALHTGDSFDEFEILDKIGSGSFSNVFLAYDTILERVVVLKQLHPDLSGDMGEWDAFVNEAQVTASFFHPGLITVHGLRIKPETMTVVLVMEYMDGGTLRDILDAQGTLDYEMLWNLAHQVGNALAYLHARGIVHRDIKPENILYSRETLWFKLTDFGLAYHPERAQFEVLNDGHPGTLRYMSPEQVQGKRNLDTESDQYTFAAVLYEAVTGQYYLPIPPEEKRSKRIARHIVYDRPARLPLIHPNAELVQRLEEVLFKALAKHPLRRFRDIQQFSREFKRVIDDMELTAEGMTPPLLA